MHIMRAFVGIDRLKVHHVTDHVILIHNAIAAMHVARNAGNVQSLAAVVALDQADHLGRGLVFIKQPPHAQHCVQAKRDFGLHIRQLLLHQLRRRQRLAEHDAVQRVIPRRMPAEFRRPQRTPGNAITRAIEAGEWTRE